MTPLLLFDPLAEGPVRQALAHNGLASHAQEWGREWQRAQASAWLHATPVPPQGMQPPMPSPESGAGESRPAAEPCAQVQAIGVVLKALPMATEGRTTMQVTAASMASPVPPASMAWDAFAEGGSSSTFVPQGGRQGVATRPSPPTETVRAAPTVREAVPDKDPVRVHVEHADDGLHVWIGANGEGAAVPARVAAVVAELRRSEWSLAMPLASIVFNGRTLHASGVRAASPGETSK